MTTPSDTLGTPEHAHQVQDADAYRALALSAGRATGAFSGLQERGHEIVEAFVNRGRWLMRCTCGNAPSAHPAWRLAICLECGSVWYPFFPNQDMVTEVERLLLTRPIDNRNWHPQETLAALRIENVAAMRRLG